MRVAIYARVSTTAQAEEGYSLGAQVEDCTRYAKTKLNATTINSFVDDGYSGAFLERPALEKLRQELAFRAYDAVVCYDADRLARGLTTQLVITDEIEKCCKLYFCNMDYQRTPEGQLFYQIKGAFSGYEREKIKQRSMRGKLAKLKQGKPLQDFRIYGYRYINETYVIEPTEAETVRLIFSTYLAGIRGGVLGVTDLLNERGIPAPRGTVWYSSSVRNILRREDYAGVHISNRTAWQKVAAHKVAKAERPQQDWLPIEMPQIISHEDFVRAQDKLKGGKIYRLASEPYLVQGIAFCACGRKMVLAKHGKYNYLRCSSLNFNNLGNNGNCGARPIRIDILNKVFWEVLDGVCRSKTRLNTYIKQKSKPNQDGNIKELEKELKSIAKEKQTLLDWWHNGIVSESDVKPKLQRLTFQQNTIQDKIKSAAVSTEPKLTPEMIVDMVRNAPADLAEKQSIVRTILDKAVIKRTDTRRWAGGTQLEIDLFFK